MSVVGLLDPDTLCLESDGAGGGADDDGGVAVAEGAVVEGGECDAAAGVVVEDASEVGAFLGGGGVLDGCEVG